MCENTTDWTIKIFLAVSPVSSLLSAAVSGRFASDPFPCPSYPYLPYLPPSSFTDTFGVTCSFRLPSLIVSEQEATRHKHFHLFPGHSGPTGVASARQPRVRRWIRQNKPDCRGLSGHPGVSRPPASVVPLSATFVCGWAPRDAPCEGHTKGRLEISTVLVVSGNGRTNDNQKRVQHNTCSHNG